MNMGQRFMQVSGAYSVTFTLMDLSQLENSYTVADDGTITLHVSQLPPNANLVTPGSILFFVTVNDVPSVGTHVIVGSGKIETQQTLAATPLPSSVKSTSGANGSGAAVDDADGAATAKSPSLGLIVGCIAGGVALLVLIGILVYVCVRRRKAEPAPSGSLKNNISKPRPGTTLGYKEYKSESRAQLAAAGDVGRASTSSVWQDGSNENISNGNYGNGHSAYDQLGGKGVAAGFAYPYQPESPESAYSGHRTGRQPIQDGGYRGQEQYNGRRY